MSEYSLKEIADEFGISEKGADSLCRRASKKFEKKLKEKLGESVTLNDILPLLTGRGDYEPLQSL